MQWPECLCDWGRVDTKNLLKANVVARQKKEAAENLQTLQLNQAYEDAKDASALMEPQGRPWPSE